MCGSVNVLEALVPLPPLAGVALYSHVGGSGGGAAGSSSGGDDGGMHVPSQSTMYSTYRKLPSYGFSFTVGVMVVTKVYEPSRLGGSTAYLAHSNMPCASTTAPSSGLHLPCTSSPLAVVLMTCSSASS